MKAKLEQLKEKQEKLQNKINWEKDNLTAYARGYEK